MRGAVHFKKLDQLKVQTTTKNPSQVRFQFNSSVRSQGLCSFVSLQTVLSKSSKQSIFHSLVRSFIWLNSFYLTNMFCILIIGRRELFQSTPLSKRARIEFDVSPVVPVGNEEDTNTL